MNSEKESHAGTIAWAVVGTFVVAWDLTAPESMSQAVDRALEHPVGKYAAIGAVALTGAHLLNLYQHFDIEHLDPFRVAANTLEYVRDKVRGSEQ